MADINSSFDEILAELGDSYDEDIAVSGRKIVRSTANKIWLQLRAFSRGLYGLYQVVASLKYRFDPLYCSEDELESTMRIAGTKLKSGKVSLLTIIIWNTNIVSEKVLDPDTYYYLSVNGVTFSLVLQEELTIPANSFVKKDFYSTLGSNPYIGAFSVSANTNISISNESGETIDSELTFDCEDNETQLGYEEETLFEARKRILTDNQRQEILHILEERIQSLPNIHECTIIANNTLAPISSPYIQDDGIHYVPILPQSVLVVLTGSPTSDFALEFLSLCPFLTTIPEGVADYGTVYYASSIYLDGHFPVHYVNHRIELFDVIIKYGYAARLVSTINVEDAMEELLKNFKATTRFKDLISSEDISDALSEYQNPGVKILAITFSYKSEIVNYIKFNKTQIARLRTVSFQQVSLWD